MPLITTDLHSQWDASVTANLSVVSGGVDTWTDEIAGYVLSAADATSRPAISSAVQINSIDVPYFNGVDSQSLNLADYSAGSGSITASSFPHQYVFAVIQVPHYSSLAFDARVFDSGAALSAGRQALEISVNGQMRIASPSSDSDLFSYPDNVPFIICAKLDETNSGVSLENTLIRINGETIIDNIVGDMVNTDGLTIGSRALTNDSTPEMAIAERLYYTKTTPLSLADIQEIEAYLNDKWAVYNTSYTGNFSPDNTAVSGANVKLTVSDDDSYTNAETYYTTTDANGDWSIAQDQDPTKYVRVEVDYDDAGTRKNVAFYYTPV